MSDLIHKGELFNALANAHDKGEIFAIIQNAPTVDAVEVVRCRECVHGKPCYGGQLIKYCDMHPEEEYFDADYYCADGERRNDE